MPSPFGPKKSNESRRNPRLYMKPLHKTTIQFAEKGTLFRIANISIGGLGFFSENNPIKPEDKKISIILNINTNRFKVDIEVMHRGEDIIGCAYLDPSPSLVATIEDYFKTELLALKMSMVETRDEAESKWKTIYFRGQNNCELVIQEIEGELQHFSIILFGNYIEGDANKTLCVGEKIGSELIAAPAGVHFYKPVPVANRHLIESAIRFIDYVQGLSEKRKKSILESLSLS